MVHIVIDANIGAGKTTLINKLKQTLSNVHFWDEPVDNWLNEGWLEKYYSNKKRYAASFQTRVLLSHLEFKKQIDNDKINICERCAYTTVYIFSQMLVNDGTMDKIEMDLHEKMLEIQNYKKPDLLIYLKTDAKTAYNRLCKRNRDGESSVPLEYLEQLEHMYEENVHKLATTVIEIDGEKLVEDVLKDCLEIFGRKEFKNICI